MVLCYIIIKCCLTLGLQLLNSHCDQVTKVTPKEWKPNHNDRAVDELQDPTSAACTLKHFEAKMNNNDLSNLIKQYNYYYYLVLYMFSSLFKLLDLH